MKILIIFSLLFSQIALADQYKHIVSINQNGLGWGGSYEKMETKSASVFADVEHIVNNIGINYGYRITDRFILGGYVRNTNSEYKFKASANSGKVEVETMTVGLYTLYNFSDTISNAWYAGVSVAHYTNEQETSHNVAIAESKNPFELDDAGMIYEAVVGKRFRLLKWNIDHLTYSPQIGFFHKTHSKDFDDQDLKNGFGVSFQPVKFDFLF